MAAKPPSSPSSSPRLPSPPPMAEDQTGSQSPSATQLGFDLNALSIQAEDQSAASRRIRPGTRAADMAEGPPLIDLAEIESAFQLTEHLKALHFFHTRPAQTPDSILPVTPPVAHLLATPPESVDRALWLYELCRFLVQKVNLVVTSLFADQPPCSAITCPEMRASEWQYLCAVHDPPKACCAIDYCCHTLDWAANVLTNPKQFPSRLTLLGENTVTPHQVRQLTNIFRRVYRIFAHAWFSHRDMFWRVEGKTGLYIFFKTVCDVYNLLPDDGYTIPPEAENRDIQTESPEAQGPSVNNSQEHPLNSQGQAGPAAHSILKRPVGLAMSGSTTPDTPTAPHPSPLNTVVASGATARRHRQSASLGASPVDTVMEENEDEDSQFEPAQETVASTTSETTTTTEDSRQNNLPTPETPAQTSISTSGDTNEESTTISVTEIADVEEDVDTDLPLTTSKAGSDEQRSSD